MKKSTYKSYDKLPLFLNAEMVANVLGVSSTVCYEMMHSGKLPVLRIGSLLIVPKKNFWNGARRIHREVPNELPSLPSA